MPTNLKIVLAAALMAGMARWQSSQLSEILLFNGLEFMANPLGPQPAWASSSRVHEIAA